MTDRIAISARERINDGSALAVVAKFFASNTLTAPTNAKYRVDTVEGGLVKDWTSLSAATSISFTVDTTTNKAQACPADRRVLSVAADYGLSTQFIETFRYDITDLAGIS